MSDYHYLILGVILGIGISLYVFASREEKINKEIRLNQKLFSTKKLNIALERAVELMQMQIRTLNRELTEDEKDKIIYKCYIDTENKQN